jgi:hypothetical protein
MMQRLTFVVLAAFWLTMSYLLWHSEMRGKGQIGASVPVEVVWEKILTAPDNSNMEIRQGTKRMGFLQWSANIGEEAVTGKVSNEEFQPEGMIRKLTEYTLDMNGSLLLGQPGKRYRFYASGRFDTNLTWKHLGFRLYQRPQLWEINASTETKKLGVLVTDGTERWEESFGFDELTSPEKIARRLGGPVLGNLVLEMAGPEVKARHSQPINQANLGIQWEAHNDWLKVGYAKARVYRLHAKFVDNQDITMYVSRVGEILKVELPYQITLINEEIR